MNDPRPGIEFRVYKGRQRVAQVVRRDLDDLLDFVNPQQQFQGATLRITFIDAKGAEKTISDKYEPATWEDD